jgi:hypothetical protein
MSVLLGVIVLFAVLSWIVAAVQAVAIMRLAGKAGHSWSDFLFGWWKFDALQAKAGPDSAPYLTIYKRAIAAFLLFVVLGLILSGWAANRAPQPASAAAGLINDFRVIPTEFAFNTDNRRVATMPGALMLES